MGISFRDLLTTKGFDPATVLMMRHQPEEPSFRKRFHWIAVNQPRLFNSYQSCQRPRQEAQLGKADYLASFIGNGAGQALFCGLYRNHGSRKLSYTAYWRRPENRQLRAFGMTGFDGSRPHILQFDLRRQKSLSDLGGRMVTSWSGERSWSRWADETNLEIIQIQREAVIEPPMPAWDNLVVAHSDLNTLWPTWQNTLSQWRGIYYILDISDRSGYVGSASGKDNLFGRWRGYGKTGHGGNKLLRGRDPKNFRFSILELLSPAAPRPDVVQAEWKWMKRLGTIEHGLNHSMKMEE